MPGLAGHCDTGPVTDRQRWTLIATVIGSGAVFLDGTIVNVALKTIGEELPATIVTVFEGQNYVQSGYLAVLAALLILAGALSDRYGRRRIYLIGLAGFAVTSALCGLAPTLEWLVLFRLFQGAAGALLIPGSLALITHAFHGPERGRAFGIWAASTAALTLAGPLVGGILVDTIGWRVAFLINVPILIVAIWATLGHVEESRDMEATGRFDWLGALVAALAVGGLTVGLIRGEAKDWQDESAWIAFGIGVISLVAFPFLMARRKDPLVPLSLFRSRVFSSINLATFFIYGALYVTLLYQALVLQGVLGYTALAAGTVGVPWGLLLVALSTRVGTVAGRIGSRRFLVAGPLISATGALWYARLPVDSTPWTATLSDPASLIPPVSTFTDVLPAVMLFGLGMSFVVAPLTTTLMGSVSGRYSGLASAINNSISRVGSPLIGALIFIVVSATFYAVLGSLLPDLDTSSSAVRALYQPLNPAPAGASPAEMAAQMQASIDAFHLAAVINAGLLATGAIISFVGLRASAMPTTPAALAPETAYS